MDLNCLLCLNETNINIRHHICSQCGKLICDECLKLNKTLELLCCPHCGEDEFFELKLEKLFKLLDRDNIENNIIYNIIG